jgi:hypothetical protein
MTFIRHFHHLVNVISCKKENFFPLYSYWQLWLVFNDKLRSQIYYCSLFVKDSGVFFFTWTELCVSIIDTHTHIWLLHLSLSHLHLFCSFRLLAFSLVEIGHVSHHHRHRSSINHSPDAWLLSACQNIVITTYTERLMINDESSARLYQPWCEVSYAVRSIKIIIHVGEWQMMLMIMRTSRRSTYRHAFIYICMFYVIVKSADHHQSVSYSRW